MTYLLLILEFFKVGLFAIGGGLATLPFLNELAEKYTWFDKAMLSDMIAISESTPGPIGINMATYAGINAAGIPGGIVATLALVAPSIIVILIIARFLQKFRNSYYVDAVFNSIRPIVTALIAAAGIDVMKLCLIDTEALKSFDLVNGFKYIEIALFVVLFILSNKFKKLHPIVFIAGAAVVGILFGL